MRRKFRAQAGRQSGDLHEFGCLPAVERLVNLFCPICWLCGAESLAQIGKFHAHERLGTFSLPVYRNGGRLPERCYKWKYRLLPAEFNMTSPISPVRDIEMTTLANGVRVITETMPHVRSVSVGIWIDTGSRRETAEQNGISHFIEHMLFKGTTNRSAEDIARSVDSIGGNLDAFTAKELVCFNTKVLDQHSRWPSTCWPTWCSIRCSATRTSRRKRASSSKKSRWRRTAPDYLVHEIFSSNFWKDHPLGKPILGTRETVKRFDRAHDPRAITARSTRPPTC